MCALAHTNTHNGREWGRLGIPKYSWEVSFIRSHSYRRARTVSAPSSDRIEKNESAELSKLVWGVMWTQTHTHTHTYSQAHNAASFFFPCYQLSGNNYSFLCGVPSHADTQKEVRPYSSCVSWRNNKQLCNCIKGEMMLVGGGLCCNHSGELFIFLSYKIHKEEGQKGDAWKIEEGWVSLYGSGHLFKGRIVPAGWRYKQQYLKNRILKVSYLRYTVS